MTREQFNQLLNYLDNNHKELYEKYPKNFVLAEDGGLGVFQPGKVSDETHKELIDIIDKWSEKNIPN